MRRPRWRRRAGRERHRRCRRARLMAMTSTALVRMMPSSSGVSREATASCASRPRPGTAKTLSMTTLPPSICADCRPSMVTSGNSALRATWASTMRRRDKPPGAGGQDKILPPGLGHAGAHHAQIEREIDEAERGNRQDEMDGDVGGAGKPGLVRGQALDAADRQPAQVDGKDDDQHQAEPEAGHGIERQRADRQETVAKAAGSGAGIDAECRAETEGKRGGADHQQQCGRQAFEDDVADRPGEGDRLAEIEMQQRPEIVGQPRQFRLVEAPAMAQQFDHAGVAAGRDDVGVDRVAGRGFQQEEGADDDDQQHEDAADETAADEGEGAGHGDMSACPQAFEVCA